MKTALSLCIIAVAAVVASCSDSDERRLAFIGDSHVARWDVQSSFPTRVTENFGISGSQISYIEQCAHSMAGKDAVVVIGTNDTPIVDDARMEAYAERYVDAIVALDASRTFLFSIFPRSVSYVENPNVYVRKQNELIRQRLAEVAPEIVYIDVFDLLMKDGTLNANLSYDGIHLNDYGYEVLTDKLNDKL